MGRHQDPRCAEPALERVPLVKLRLQIGDDAAVGEPLDGLNVRAFCLDCEAEARVDDPSILQD